LAKRSSYLVLMLLILYMIYLFTYPSPVRGRPEKELVFLKSSLDEGRILDHIKYFSSFETRLTGTQGFYKAADYIEKKLRQYGLRVWREEFNVTVPVVEEAYIEVLMENGSYRLPVYPLWPNHVCLCSYESPPEGDELVYVGSVKDLGEKNVKGKFVLLDYNTRALWKVLSIMGAKGVLFIEPAYTTYAEGMLKSLNVPLYFPRLYLKYGDALKLIRLMKFGVSFRIRVHSKISWENKPAYNIVAEIEGTDPLLKGEIMVLAAYYDSYSPVLGLAPGATDSLGISFLLEYARALKIVKPKRTVWIVALAAHYQYLWGAREFVKKHFDEIGVFIKGFLSLDLSSDNDQLGLYALGLGYGYINPDSLVNQKYSWVPQKFFDEWLKEAESMFGEEYHVFDMVTYSYPPWVKMSPPMNPPYLYLDSEPFTASAFGGGLSFVTTNTLRPLQQTPLDVFDKLNLGNFFKQVRYLWITLFEYINMDIPYVLTPARFYGDWGFVNLQLQLAKYNVNTAWYDNFSSPNAVFYVYTSNMPANSKWISKGFSIVIKAGDKGAALLSGLKPYSTVDVQGYVLDESGKVVYATDTGVYGLQRTLVLTVPEAYKLVPVFEAATIILLQPLNPQSLQMKIKEVNVLNFLSHTPLIHRDYVAPAPTIMTTTPLPSTLQDIAVFVEPGVPSEVVVMTDEPYPLIVLNNASAENPGGKGFLLDPGDMVVASPLDYARDMYFLALSRANILIEKSAVSAQLHEYYTLMEEFIKAFSDPRAPDLERYAYSFNVWAFSRSTYGSAMSQIYDIVVSTLFFMFLSVPFAIGMERLMFSLEGVKRISAVVAIYVLTLFTLALFHPGFYVATNVYVLAVAASLGILVFMLIVILLGETYSWMKKLREAMIGKHFMEIERFGLLVTAFSTGARNLRKRRVRTALTLISVICSVFALTAFTSITSGLTVSTRVVGRAPYTGIMIERAPWMVDQPLPEEFLLELQLLLGRNYTVSARSWIYPQGFQLLYSWNASKMAPVRGIIALGSGLLKALEIHMLPVAVTPYDEYSYGVIINERMAESLSMFYNRTIDVGDQIDLLGFKLTILGIVRGDVLWSREQGVIDLNQRPITPIDLRQGAGEYFKYLSGGEVLIIPYGLAQEMVNSQPLSISIIPKGEVSEDELLHLGEVFAKRLMLDVYVGSPESRQVIVIAPRIQYFVGGLETVIIPLIIVGFTVLTTMLNAMYERVREMKVYSAVGLAPLHVTGMFLAEAFIYAVIGSILGYITGMMGTWLLWTSGAYPENFYPNYASIGEVVVVVVIVAFTLLSALYPALKASTLITPSFERRWKIETRPQGNVWSLPLPFKAVEKDVYGVFEFLREYFEAHSIERMGLFFVEGGFAYREDVSDGRDVKIMEFKVRLAPFDQGIMEKVSVVAQRERGRVFGFEIIVYKESGPEIPWISSNRAFFREVRKQFLSWRSLGDEAKNEYVERGLSRFREVR